MKKLFLFLSIIMLSLSGLFYACTQDKYSDLNIHIDSVVEVNSGKAVEFNKNENCYIVNYNDTFVVNASITSSSSINTSLRFESINDNSINKISSTDTEKGSRAIFRAVAPSYDNLYKIKISSVETSQHSQYIFIKVILPVREILLDQNLGLTFNSSIDLNSIVTYVISDPSCPYETNEKGVTFSLISFIDESLIEHNLYQKPNDPIYYFLNGNTEIAALKIAGEKLYVLNESLEGQLVIEAKSLKYNNNLDLIDPEAASDQQLLQISANNKLKDMSTISIIKGITIDDISFLGGQISFFDIYDDGVRDVKLGASLYLNSHDTYQVGEQTFQYRSESIKLTVYTKISDIKIGVLSGSMTVGSQTFLTDKNVVSFPSADELVLNPIKSLDEQTNIGFVTDILITANEESGFAYLDFVIEFNGFSNKIEYKFSDLYKNSLMQNEYNFLIEEQESYNKLVFEITALPSDILLTQDDKTLEKDQNILVYDWYQESYNTSYYGTKICANLIKGATTSRIKNENKKVRVFVSDSSYSGLNVKNYLEIRNFQFSKINLLSTTLDEGGIVYYFDLDLSKESSYFYIKALNPVTSTKFILNFENILSSSIYAFNGEEIVSNSEQTSLTNLQSKIFVNTVKGIDEILVLTKILNEENENEFYAIDSNNLGDNPLYQKLVLKEFLNPDISAEQGTLITYFINLNAFDSLEIINSNPEIIKIFNIDFSALSDSYGYSNDEVAFKGALSVVGIKTGSATILFNAPNGFSVEVNVVVVKEFSSYTIDLEQSYGKNIIAQNRLNVYDEEPYASAKINGTFNIISKINPNSSGVIDISYDSSVSGIVSINKNGQVTTVSQGQTQISVVLNYYAFTKVGQYYQWTNLDIRKLFTLEVFVPASSIKLDKYIINTYDYNSLGYEYRDNFSNVFLSVVVLPINATIANDSSFVKFRPSNNVNLVGSNGVYTAFLKNNETRAKVYIYVEVEEFGKIVTFICTVNIFKAPQIENISLSVSENGQTKVLKDSSTDSDGHQVLYLSTENSRSLKLNSSIIPTANQVLIEDLTYVLFNADQSTLDVLETDSEMNFATLVYKDVSSFNVTTKGLDSLSLNINSSVSGYFYLFVFAKDSMTDSKSGKVYLKILIEITDGTLQNPYEIETLNQLINIKNSPTKHYVLASDINIGSISNWTPIKNFSGTLNGFNSNVKNGTYYKISGLQINNLTSANIGLFETISNSQTSFGGVFNLTLEVNSILLNNITVSDSISASEINIGTIAGQNNGLIMNCAVSFNSFKVSVLNRDVLLGGIVGLNKGAIYNFANPVGNKSSDFDLDFSSSNNTFVNYKDFIASKTNIEDYNLVSSNCVSGNIVVSDSKSEFGESFDKYVLAGGIAGKNQSGFISGLFGIYNYLQEISLSGTNFITNYQSQGIDSSVNINYGSESDIGKIESSLSSLGGIAGLMEGGSIKNVSSEGRIGSYNSSQNTFKGAYENIGGIVGKTVEIVDYNYIENVQSSSKLRGNSFVGGIVGRAEKAKITKARTESYETSSDSTYIIARTNAGGVVGAAYSSVLELVYSYSYISTFNESYIENGDVLVVSDEAVAGGIIGFLDKLPDYSNTILSKSFSTFNVVAKGENAYVSGLIGWAPSGAMPSISDVYYTGVLSNVYDLTGNRSDFALNILGGTYVISGYYYYYLFNYADSNDIEEGTNFDILVLKQSFEGDETRLDGNFFWSTDNLYSLNYYIFNMGDLQPVNKNKKVLVYTIRGGETTCNFIKSIPNNIEVAAKKNFEMTDRIELEFKTDGEKNRYFGYQDITGNYLILNYSILYNKFSLNDLFEVNASPFNIGVLNIFVTSSNQNIVKISNLGEIIINNTGSVTLTFTVRENIVAFSNVTLIIVQNFDELLVSSTPTYTKSFFENVEENKYLIRVDSEINIFGWFAQYVKNAGSKRIYGQTTDVDGNILNLVEIANTDNYTLQFYIEYEENGQYIPVVAEDQVDVSGNILKFNYVGNYKIVLSVLFNVENMDFRLIGDWSFYFNVYSGATEISTLENLSELELMGQGIFENLKIALTTDSGEVENLIFVITDSVSLEDYTYEIFYLQGESLCEIVFDSENDTKDLAEIPFEFNVSFSHVTDKTYYYDVVIFVKSENKNVTIPKNYVLSVFDACEILKSNPVSINIKLVPQSVKGISGVHYTYTQQVSELENVTNTNASGLEETTYSYSFSSDPKNTVLAGSEGLFVVDVYPYYSNITSISIESDISENSGNALQFIQLVKIAGTGGKYYYIYAPTPAVQKTETGGIYLNKVSFVPENVAKINYLDKNHSTLEFLYGNNKLSYAFGENDYSEVGRLYIKTIAPNLLNEYDEFNIYVKIKYLSYNSSGEFVEQEMVYMHTLEVEQMPEFSLSVEHDGFERNVIAYTATGSSYATPADWLDIVPVIKEGIELTDLSYEIFRESVSLGSASDYFLIEKTGNEYKLVLGSKARSGDVILLTAYIRKNLEGHIEERILKYQITVVDLVIENVTIKDLNNFDVLTITVSTSKQLKAIISGFGTESAINDAQNTISRLVSSANNSIQYWYADPNIPGYYYTNLDAISLKNHLPFGVTKMAISAEEKTVTVSSDTLGASLGQERETFTYLSKIVVLEGLTKSGTIDMRLWFSYVYQQNGKIDFVPNDFSKLQTYRQEKYFTVRVTEDSNEENPTPIYNESDLKAMAATNGGNYILMSDISLTNHAALSANFASFDGNNKIITINSFYYSTSLSGSSGYSINMGLFNTVSQNTIIKNVIVALPADKNAPMNLKGYSTINFGAIAAINNGIITNCDVISVTDLSADAKTLISYSSHTNLSYTINIETSVEINKNEVTANIGGLVAINNSTGFITNSRVGREDVDILTVYDSEATVVYKNKYEKTAPITVIKLYGRGNVGGLIALNSGTIATSYANNIQLEVVSQSATSFVSTGGFVATNNGYIYGSYAAGWEEEIVESSTASLSRKLGGGIYTNGMVGGFVFYNNGYIEDCYSNLNLSGSLSFAAKTSYIRSYLNIFATEWVAPAAAGFDFRSSNNSYIKTSYSISKINPGGTNTHGAFSGREVSNNENEGQVENSYFLMESSENFSYEHEKAQMLSDSPVIDLEDTSETSGINEFITEKCFNGFSFDSDQNFKSYDGTSTGGVWAMHYIDSFAGSTGTHGYPQLISANTVSISCKVINVTKTNESETNTYYYTYVDGYEIGSYLNPYLVSSFEQYNNIFKDAVGNLASSLNENINIKFTGNIRLIKNINFLNSEEVYSTSIEYTSLIDQISIFDGNYMAIYNLKISDKSTGKSSFGLFKDIYYAAVKNLTLVVTSVNAGNTTAVGALAGVIVNSNISNITLISAGVNGGIITGNNYVGGLAGIIISKDDNSLFKIVGIKSNLSIVGGTSSSLPNSSALRTSFILWERIRPSSSTGLSEINNNLSLHRLPVDVFYAGSIAGVLDLHQHYSNNVYEIVDQNAFNIHAGEIVANTILSSNNVSYTKPISVISDYSGGLFGFIGQQTYLECADFIVSQASENQFINGNLIAGGIAAVNFGKISQSYVSYSKENVSLLSENIGLYVNQTSSVDVVFNQTLFSEGTPVYIGGIAGINVGNGTLGTGNIINCFNRVNVKNESALGVGGIAGGSYIGQISNVYSTASLLGDLEKQNLKIGAIIGKIFEDGSEGYFADYYDESGEYGVLSLFNIVALSIWDPIDFNDLYYFVMQGGKIGALYGGYENQSTASSKETGIVRITDGIYVQNFALIDYTIDYISTVEIDEVFDISHMDDGSYFRLWGVQNIDDKYLNACLCSDENKESLIFPNNFRALFSGIEFGVSTLRNTYFSETKWSRTIWNYDDENLLPILEYGYESSVIRIYTAQQFKTKLGAGNSAGKLYVIMNDIDFDGVLLSPFAATFRGQLYGNNVTFESNGNTYIRKPILFNITLDGGEAYSTSIFSIFQNSIGATFSNFNIALKKYKVKFSSLIAGETISSVLVGNATNTSFSNVHIYSSLTDAVNKECMLDYEFVGSGASLTFNVAQGWRVDEDKKIAGYSTGFLKLANLSTDIETEVFEDFYYFVLNPSETQFELSFVYHFKDKTIEMRTGHYITVGSKAAMQTNATTVGSFVGIGSLSYISYSSTSLDISIEYNKKNSSSIALYIGGVVGKNIGEIRYIVSTAAISVECKYDFVSGEDLKEMYLGGIVGSTQGILRFIYVKEASINLGRETRYIVSTSGETGFFVGGIVGAVDKYITTNEAVVGGAYYLYVMDSTITAYINGKSAVAGAIAKNRFSVGDIYVKQLLKDLAIKVYINDTSTSASVGGIIGENNSSSISNLYNNNSIFIKAGKPSTFIYAGGIIGKILSDCELTNVIADGEKIEIINSQNIGNVYAGGILGGINTNDSHNSVIRISIFNALSTFDIICDQQNTLMVGGLVGCSNGLSISNVISLGDIILNRGSGENVLGLPYYYFGENYIGGMIGNCTSSYYHLTQSKGVLVASTIRDYAIAQKTHLNIGPVFGNKNENVTSSSSSLLTYFNENISLISDNGYNKNSSLKNVSQNELGGYLKIILNDFSFGIDNECFSNYLTKYFDDSLSVLDFKNGSKLKPNVFSSTFEDNNYYILNSSITNRTSSYSTAAKNWILNAQGYSIKNSQGAIFDTITEGSAVVGLLVNDVNFSNLASSGILAKTNNGFVFSCGTSGTINNNNPSCGLVANNFGVINSSFSVGNITVSSGAGLVLVNGKTDFVGNIYSCFYTGTIKPHQNATSSSWISGIANNSSFGIISNCYTIGDLDITEKTVNTYPIAYTEGNKENLLNCYYDYVAYAGSTSNEGVSLQNAQNSNFITKNGIYVWSASLAGNLGGLNYSDISDVLSGNWLNPGDKTELENLYKKSKIYIPGETIYIDTSWFNFGYTTNNFVNIIINLDPVEDNVMKYFSMFYSGNGLADVENVSQTTNGFVNQPFNIKHAGMLDILVRSSNSGLNMSYKYYIFTKNIDFIKYTNETYWSQSWDENSVIFVGDLNGFGKSVINMHSSFGLLRAIPKVEVVTKESCVRNLTFKDCYSQTGLIAGFLANATIKNITVGSAGSLNYVYNGNLETISGNNLGGCVEAVSSIIIKTGDNIFVTKSNRSADNKETYFAGGLIGIMEGGTIEPSCTFSNFYVIVNSEATDISYAGGLVGVMKKGTIGSLETWNLSNINVYASIIPNAQQTASKSFIGGVVGYAGKLSTSDDIAIIKNLNIQNVKVHSFYTMGGIVGELNGANLINCRYSSTQSGNFEFVNSAISKTTINTTTNIKTSLACVGGIAGLVKSGKIEGCTFAGTINFTNISILNSNSAVYCGGIASQMETGNIISSTVSGIISLTVANQSSISGGVVGKMSGGIIKFCSTSDNSKLIEASGSIGYAGGIVGLMIKGTIEGEENNKIQNEKGVVASTSAGGIVGRIECKDDSCVLNYCLNTGSVQNATYVGGTIGIIYCTPSKSSSEKFVEIKNCESKTGVIGTESSNYSGGIVGLVYGSKNNENVLLNFCQNSSLIKTKSGSYDAPTFAGGIAGFLQTGQISSCTNGGSTDKKALVAGGIVGYLAKGDVENSSSLNSANIVANKIAGGIIGFMNNGVLTSSSLGISNASNVYTDSGDGGGIAGGVVGLLKNGSVLSDLKIANSGAVGDSGTLNKNSIAGGIFGLYANSLTKALSNLENTGAVKNNSYTNVGTVKWFEFDSNFVLQIKDAIKDIEFNSSGGIIGVISANLSLSNVNSKSEGNIIAIQNAGGIVGLISNGTVTITNATNSKIVNSSDIAGGIVGKIVSGGISFLTEKPESDKSDIVYSTILNSGEITGSNFAGGIVGQGNNILKFEGGSFNKISNTGVISSSKKAGGIIGSLEIAITLKYVSNSGSVSAGKTESTNGNAGGLVGYMKTGSIDNSCSVSVTTALISGYYTGGIVGYAENATINCSISRSTISGYYAGGIAGCIETGIISSDVGVINVNNSVVFSSSTYVGGMVGYIKSVSSIKGTVNCDVSGGSVATGGIAGKMDGGSLSSSELKIEGVVSGSLNCSVGGLIGIMDGDNCRIQNGVVLYVAGSGNSNVGGLVGLMIKGIISGGFAGLGIDDCISTTGNGNVGGFVGKMLGGTISGGTCDGVVSSTSTANAGGFVGEMSGGTITNGVTGMGIGTIVVSTGNGNVGGFAGKMTGGTINGGTCDGNVIGSSAVNVGGFVGLMSNNDDEEGGKIRGGICNGNVAGGLNTGGIAGSALWGEITNGECKGNISGGSNVGGAAGYASIDVKVYKITGNVSGSVNVGGLVGHLYNSTLINGEIEGEVSGLNNTGGLVGFLENSIIKSGSGGSVLNGENRGGLAGKMTGNNASIEGGTADSVSAGGFNAGGIVGLMENGAITGGASVSVSNAVNSGGIAGSAASGLIAVSPKLGTSVGGTLAGGGLIGTMYGNFTIAADSRINVSGGYYAGGLVGYFESSNLNLIIDKNINISGEIMSVNVGAVTGYMSGSSKIGNNSMVTINLSCTLINFSGVTNIGIGGLVPKNTGTISNITVNGGLELESSVENFGVITLENSGIIYNCVNKVNLEMSLTNLGGIAGIMTGGTIYNCQNYGDIVNTNDGALYLEFPDLVPTWSITCGGIVGLITGGDIGGSSCLNAGSIKVNSTNPNITSKFGIDLLYAISLDSLDNNWYAGGIAGKTETTGTVEGSNVGIIRGPVSFRSNDDYALITDHRGQITGANINYATIKNLTGHTEGTVGVESITRVYDDPIRIAVSFKSIESFESIDDVTNLNVGYKEIPAVWSHIFDRDPDVLWQEFCDEIDNEFTIYANTVSSNILSGFKDIVSDFDVESSFWYGIYIDYWGESYAGVTQDNLSSVMNDYALSVLYDLYSESSYELFSDSEYYSEIYLVENFVGEKNFYDAFDYAVVYTFYIKPYTLSYRQKFSTDELQDCGGQAGNSHGETAKDHFCYALNGLYELCGPCDLITSYVEEPEHYIENDFNEEESQSAMSFNSEINNNADLTKNNVFLTSKDLEDKQKRMFLTSLQIKKYS